MKREPICQRKEAKNKFENNLEKAHTIYRHYEDYNGQSQLLTDTETISLPIKSSQTVRIH